MFRKCALRTNQFLVIRARACAAGSEPARVEWLDDEVNGSVTNRIHERLFLVKGSHHDDLGLGIERANLPRASSPPMIGITRSIVTRSGLSRW